MLAGDLRWSPSRVPSFPHRAIPNRARNDPGPARPGSSVLHGVLRLTCYGNIGS
jgi:hypothetical protein